MLQFYGPMNFWRRIRHRFDYPRPLGELSDRAYADLLLQFQEREGSTDNTTQSPFRRALIEAYNSKDPEDEEGLWCPVMQTFSCDPDQRRGAHIFRKKYGQKVMKPGLWVAIGRGVIWGAKTPDHVGLSLLQILPVSGGHCTGRATD